ncbi:hypothetical protein BC829DRAFT_482057 [Chytridium lagenaria]|nr:hypothetical protein BC829DRAFT_482057 [Chytridium lagenaria]
MPKSNGAAVSFSSDQDHHDKRDGEDNVGANRLRKKRKTAHACRPCQEAHLVCDENRPCFRCSRKGMSESCVDGIRKKAKYMEDALFQKEEISDPQYPPGATEPPVQNSQYTSLSGHMSTENPYPQHSIRTSHSPTNIHEHNLPVQRISRPSDVYSKVLKPYDYREGFHYLVSYIKDRKRTLCESAKSLAQFRPSFMAQIMNLSEEDLLFMEKCFQRTLVEFDKLIGFSGTPTVVWRRTGEIALVGKEFSLLTQWPREQLLEKRTYIYELMDTTSVVEYWEKFSTLSFENSQQSCMLQATLLTPSNVPVKCAFCFTIKRDIFDVPLAIVGNFLPLFQVR